MERVSASNKICVKEELTQVEISTITDIVFDRIDATELRAKRLRVIRDVMKELNHSDDLIARHQDEIDLAFLEISRRAS